MAHPHPPFQTGQSTGDTMFSLIRVIVTVHYLYEKHIWQLLICFNQKTCPEYLNDQALEITCRSVRGANVSGLNHPYLSFHSHSDSGEVFHKCPPPPCLDSLVNPAPYSLPEPIIFHSHSHFWIGNSKSSPCHEHPLIDECPHTHTRDSVQL